MKMTDEVKAALQTLRNNAEHDFERYWVDRLEQDLTNPPRVEVIDESHQKFNNRIFSKRFLLQFFSVAASMSEWLMLPLHR